MPVWTCAGIERAAFWTRREGLTTAEPTLTKTATYSLLENANDDAEDEEADAMIAVEDQEVAKMAEEACLGSTSGGNGASVDATDPCLELCTPCECCFPPEGMPDAID